MMADATQLKSYLTARILVVGCLPWVPGPETSQRKLISSLKNCVWQTSQWRTCFVYRWTSVW